MISVPRVLRWTVRHAAVSTFSPLHLQPLCTGCRSFCSPSSRDTQRPTRHTRGLSPLSGEPVTELSLRSLVDMGFTDTQAERICDAVSKARGGSVAKHAPSTLTALLMMGLNASSVLKLLEKCPELYTVKGSQLEQRIGNLRKLGLVEGSLQRVVSHFPQILTVPVKTIKNVVLFFKERLLFTAQQVTDTLRDSPAVVLENMDQLEYKFQYVYFQMGVKQTEMLKYRLFNFTLDEVRHRHSFLERRGLYQTPDKKGQTFIINPKLDSILGVDQDTFLTEIAKASAEEYDVFKRLMAREWQEAEQPQGRIEADRDDDDDDDDDAEDAEEEEDDEDEEAGGKSGYMKKRKK